MEKLNLLIKEYSNIDTFFTLPIEAKRQQNEKLHGIKVLIESFVTIKSLIALIELAKDAAEKASGNGSDLVNNRNSTLTSVREFLAKNEAILLQAFEANDTSPA